MKKLKFSRAKNTLCGKILRRILGEECGAVAMEYIVIALLVAAAIVGLVIVFSGSLQSMLGQIIGVTQSTNNSQIGGVQCKRNNEKAELTTQLNTAEDNAKAIADGQGGKK